MGIATWSARRIVWLWVGVLTCYGAFITVGAVQNHRARRAFERSWGIPPAPAEASDTMLSPAQLALRDSLVDSLKRIMQSYLDSPEENATATGIATALIKSLPSTREPVIAFVLFSAPALTLLIVTIVWFTRRKAAFRRAGA